MIRFVGALFVWLFSVLTCGAWTHGDAGPQGRLVLNLGGLSVSNLVYPLIDIQKMANQIRLTISGVDYNSTTAPSGATSAWPYLDSDGQPVAPLPVGTTSIRYGSFYLAPSIIASGGTRAGIAMKATWDGSASSVSISSGTGFSAGANSATWTWTTDASNINITFNTPSLSDPPRNLKVFAAANESLLNAGEVFDPIWLEWAKKGGNTFRFMDWMSTNANVGVRRWSEIAPRTYYTLGQSLVPGIKGGFPPSLMTDLAAKANKNLWVTIPHVFGTYKVWPVTAVTSAANAVVTAPGHTFQDGDRVIMYLGNLQSSATVSFASDGTVTWTAHGLPADAPVYCNSPASPLQGSLIYYVVGSSIAANTFKMSATPGGAAIVTAAKASDSCTSGVIYNEMTVSNTVGGTSFQLNGPGADSRPFSAYTSGAYVTSPYNLADITTEITTFATHFRDNVTAPRYTIFEKTNEPWNSGGSFGQYRWLQAQSFSTAAQAISGVPGRTERMYGYLSAHIMKTIGTVYGGNTRWKGVLNVQTADAASINAAVAGANAYKTQFGIGGSIGTLFNDGYAAVTGYWSGTFSSANVTATNGWLNTSIDRFNNALEPTQYTYFIRQATENARSSASFPATTVSIADLKNTIWPAIKTVANANGLGLIQYEAGAHDNLSATQYTDAQFADFWMTMRYDPVYAALYTEMFQAFLDIGGVAPSKFVEAAGQSPQFGSWGAMRWLGGGVTNIDTNPVWNAVQGFNFLLKRDMNPASNDNSPMWLEAAA
jgi:hypothetical protein